MQSVRAAIWLANERSPHHDVAMGTLFVHLNICPNHSFLYRSKCNRMCSKREQDKDKIRLRCDRIANRQLIVTWLSDNSVLSSAYFDFVPQAAQTVNKIK